jgi:hypothetical protein
MDGLEKTLLSTGSVHLFPKVKNMGIDRARTHIDTPPPDKVQKSFTTDDLATPDVEGMEKTGFGWRERDHLVALEAKSLKVDLDPPKEKVARRFSFWIGRRIAQTPAEERMNTSEKFLESKGFAKKIVSPEFESEDSIRNFVPDR